jgi:hypothetical protein
MLVSSGRRAPRRGAPGPAPAAGRPAPGRCGRLGRRGAAAGGHHPPVRDLADCTMRPAGGLWTHAPSLLGRGDECRFLRESAVVLCKRPVTPPKWPRKRDVSGTFCGCRPRTVTPPSLGPADQAWLGPGWGSGCGFAPRVGGGRRGPGRRSAWPDAAARADSTRITSAEAEAVPSRSCRSVSREGPGRRCRPGGRSAPRGRAPWRRRTRRRSRRRGRRTPHRRRAPLSRTARSWPR